MTRKRKPAESTSELHEILARGRFSPMTRDKYSRVIDDWLRFAGKRPDAWTRQAAQAYYDSLLRRMKVGSANVWFASLRYVSSWYAKIHQKPELDFAIVQTQLGDPNKSEERHPLSPDDAIALLSTCIDGQTDIDRRDRTILLVGLETGMRRKSLAGMLLEKFEDASPRRPYPSINVPIKGPGGAKTWDVPLSDTAMLVLREWMLWLAQQRLTKGPILRRFRRTRTLSSVKAVKHVDTWSLIKDGLSEEGVWDVVTRRGEQAGIHVFPHLLRHSFITWRAAQGLGPSEIASITGHLPPGGWGAMKAYLDLSTFAAAARAATPLWLADFVRERLR